MISTQVLPTLVLLFTCLWLSYITLECIATVVLVLVLGKLSFCTLGSIAAVIPLSAIENTFNVNVYLVSYLLS